MRTFVTKESCLQQYAQECHIVIISGLLDVCGLLGAFLINEINYLKPLKYVYKHTRDFFLYKSYSTHRST